MTPQQRPHVAQTRRPEVSREHLRPGMLRAIEVLEAYRRQLGTGRFLILGAAIVELQMEVERL